MDELDALQKQAEDCEIDKPEKCEPAKGYTTVLRARESIRRRYHNTSSKVDNL